MNSEEFAQTIVEAERVGILLYVVVAIVGTATVPFVALSANDHLTALNAGVSVVSGVVVLAIIRYLETHVWNSE